MCFPSLCPALRKGNGNKLRINFKKNYPYWLVAVGFFFVQSPTLAIKFIAAPAG